MSIRRFININVNSNKHIEAYFEQIRYGLYIEKIGSGIVKTNDNTINCGYICYKDCEYNENITLEAISHPGFSFIGWMGDFDIELSNNQCQVNMDSEKTIVAVFCEDGSDLPLTTPSPTGTTTPSPTGTTTPSPTGTITPSPTTPTGTTTPSPTGTTTTPSPQMHTLTVIRDGYGYVQSNDNEIDCGLNCSQQYIHNTQVILLEPIPSTGYNFSHWSGAGSGNQNRIILMNTDKEVIAHFTKQQFELTVEISGNGCVDSINSFINCSNLCTYNFDYNTLLNLVPTPDVGMQFIEWQINSVQMNSNIQTIVMNQDHHVIAIFDVKSYTLSISISGNGNVETNDALIDCPLLNCDQEYDHGTSIILNAISTQHYSFSHWTGDLTGSENNRHLTIYSNKSITAVFEPNQYDLQVVVEGLGTVTSTPGSINCGTECQDSYDYNTEVTLIAEPDTGYSFSHWTGDLISANSTDNIIVDSDKSVTAHFIINNYTISLSVNGEGDVTSSDSLLDCPDNNCAQIYEYNTSVALVASNDNHWVFDHWSGALTGSNPSKSIIIDSNKSVVANFVLEQFNLNIIISGEGTVDIDPGSNCNFSPCQNSYDYDTEVTLIAEPDIGWSFSHWSGDLTGSNTEKTIIIDSNRSVTAHFTINQYYLNVETEGNGDVITNDTLINCPTSICSQLYDYDTSVELTAIPHEHWDFHTWELDLTHQSPNTTLSMVMTKFVRAIFIITDYSVNVSVDGDGTIQSLPTGINCPGTCQCDYQYSTILALTATPTIGWEFSHWSGDLTGNELNKNLTVNSDKDVTAHFTITTHDLIVNVEGNGSVHSSPSGIDCPSACSYTYDYATDVSLTAQPDDGSTFVSWSMDLSGSNPSESVLMTTSKEVKATFELIPYTVNVSVVGEGNVTTTDSNIDCPNECSHVYYYNDNITLVATPGFEYHFVEWSGDASGTNISKSMTITDSKNIIATFEINEYTLIVNKNGEGSVSGSGINCGANCSEDYEYGTIITLTAEPITGWYFSHWVISNWSGSSAELLNSTISFMIDENREATAYFEIHTYELSIQVVGEGTVTSDDGYINCGEGNSSCLQIYDYDTEVILTATPAIGYEFVNWSGDISSTNETITVTMQDDKSIIANFEIIQHTLTITKQGNGYITSSPAGIECGAVTDHPFLGTISNTICQFAFDYSTLVSLTTSADVGYVLDSATGNYQSIDTTNEIITVLMDQDNSIEVIFVQSDVTLEVRNMVVDQHGTVVSDISSCIDCNHQYGSPLPDDCTCEIPQNYNIELSSNADEFYRLIKWELEGITIIKIGNGYGSIYAVRHDNYLHITPDAESGYVFCGWLGDYDTILPDNIAKVEINQGNVIQVCFSTDDRQLTVIKTGDVDLAYVVSEPGGIYCGDINQYTFNTGSQVSLIVYLDPSTEIQSVTGPYDYIDDNIIYVTMDDHKEIEIDVIETCYTLDLVNIIEDKNGDIYSYPTGIVCGSVCTYCMLRDNNIELVAIADENYRLEAWRYEDVTVYKEGLGFGVIYITQISNKLYITPDPHPGYVFCGWTGDYINIDADNIAEVATQQGNVVYCCFAIPTKTLTVVKSGDPNASAYIISEPGGIYYGNIDNYDFDIETQVILTVNLDTSSEIESVSGDYEEFNNNQIIVTMNVDKTIEITLSRSDVMLTLVNLGEDDPNTTIYSYPIGIECGDVCQAYMPVDAGVELQTDSESEKTITKWQFENITINRWGRGYGSIYTNKNDSILTIIPDPFPGYVFGGWDGDYDTITGNIANVSIGPPKTVICYFTLPLKTLTVTKINTNSGDAVIFSEPGSYNSINNNHYNFEINTVVYLIARRAPNTTTVIWHGDYIDVVDDVIQVVMDSSKTIEVDFEVV